MNTIKTITWFTANLAWNTFFGLLVAVAVYSIMSGKVDGEAASIGLVEVSETVVWSTMAIGGGLGWIISTTCGWAAIFTGPAFWIIFLMSNIG